MTASAASAMELEVDFAKDAGRVRPELHSSNYYFEVMGRFAARNGPRNRLANYLQHAGNVAIPFMVCGELYFGAAKSDRRKHNEQVVREFLSVFPIIHSTDEILSKFGALKAELQRKGAPVEDADVLIAATAMSLRVPLATSNVKHMSRFAGLEILDWFSA